MKSPANTARGALIKTGAVAAIIIFTLLLLIAGSGPDALAVNGGIVITTNQFVYQPDGKVTFGISADSGGQDLSGELVVKVYPASSPLATDAFTAAPLSEKSVTADFRVSGTAGAEFEAELGDLGVGTGGFPVKVSLMSGGAEVLSGTTWLAVVDPVAHDPLDLVLLWTVGGPPERDPQGVFQSTYLLGRCQNDPRTPDTLIQHPELAAKYPAVKTTYAIEGSLLDELADMSDGFRAVSGDGINEATADSADAQTAAGCMEGLRQLSEAQNAEIISTPYVFASLPVLAREGWDDGNGQFRIGHDILGEVMALPAVPKGAYIPGLDLTTDSLRYIASTGGEYAVLAGSIRQNVVGRPAQGEATFRLRDLSGERITSLFAADDASASLLGDDPDPNAFFASLANTYDSSASRLVIAASGISNPRITAQERERVYGAIAGQPWIRTITLGEAKTAYRPSTEPVTLQRYIDPLEGYVSRTYYQKLSSVHDLFEAYRLAVETDEPELLRLAKNMYTAESEYFLKEDIAPEEANRGLAYLDQVSAFVDQELEGLNLSVETPLIQRSPGGEARVTIVNENLYSFTVDLELMGEGITFPEGEARRLRLETGRTEITVPYEAGGWSTLQARLAVRGYPLVEDGAGVHPMSAGAWIVVVVALAALLGGVGYYLLVVRRRTS